MEFINVRTQDMLAIFVAILVFSSVAMAVWALWPEESRRLVRQRIEEVSKTKRPGSLAKLLAALGSLNKRLPVGWYTRRLTRLLEAGGVRISAVNFLVFQQVGACVGLVLYLVVVSKVVGQQEIMMRILGIVACVMGGAFAPVLWMNNRARARRLTISRDLPEVVDLLTLCIGAGTDLLSALNRVVREFRPCPVRDELAIVLQEMRVGRRRRDAIHDFAMRLNSTETSAFARTLIQVDRMGTGLSQAMAVLSEDMRLQRYNWAERFAQQAPVKMLLPLMLTLGSAMIVIAGPILIRFFRGDLMIPAMMAPAAPQVPKPERAPLTPQSPKPEASKVPSVPSAPQSRVR